LGSHFVTKQIICYVICKFLNSLFKGEKIMKKNSFTWRLLFVLTFCLSQTVIAHQEEIEKPSTPRYMFLDPLLAEVKENVTIRVNPPLSKEIVLRRENPWEFIITYYLSVIDEGDKLRMWYNCRDAKNVLRYLGYAESTDGVHWKKPNLGLISFNGSRENNLINLSSFEGNVFRDPNAKSEEEQYVYVTNSKGGISRYHSPNGLTWTRDEKPLFGFECDSQNCLLWDPFLKKYVLFLRGWARGRTVARLEVGRIDQPIDLYPHEGNTQRNIRNIKRLPLIRSELPVTFKSHDSDPANTEIYTNAMQLYPVDPHWYIGFPSMYRLATPPKHPVTGNSDGRTEIRFVASKDGKKWEEFDRSAYISPGVKGDEDENIIYVGAGMVVRGNEVWQYATGHKASHGDAIRRETHGDGTIYLYRQRIDGFVSLDFPDEGGRCVTQPVKIEEEQLLLNLDTGALGNLRVGLLDKNGKPIKGFSVEDCVPLQTNDLSATVSWKTKNDLKELKEKIVQLELQGKRSKLYSFRFESP
jgi:hypothetical protein